MADYNKPTQQYDDSKVRKGQAYNLAILTAIADGKQHDNEYIARQFLRHLQFAQLLQKADNGQLAAVLSNEKVLALIAELDKEVGK